MDFNDINIRLQRLYVTIGEQYDYSIEKHIKHEVVSLGGTRKQARITFGNSSQVEILNKVFNVIHALAGLKDHLKTRMTQIGKNPKEVEDLINETQELSLVIDLDNQDKHGSPLTKTNRSGKQPRLANLQQALSGDGPSTLSITFNGMTGQIASQDGPLKIVIIGDVMDGSDSKIMPLEQLLDKALKSLEDFISSNEIA
ncbi:MAG TPA: hypothetical protein VNX65_01155 [Patescibacteria group bacterium]|jgi:hypothetical protein|nr:hypothetical protein [Patescibacteria group bacterium]